MENLPENIFDLDSGLQQYLDALKVQINKDLQKVGNYQFQTSAIEVKLWIPVLSLLIRKLSDNELNQLLYVVDLPENWSKNILVSEDPLEQLAEAILKREWAKIYFRIKFM